jgi:hypothetical protein
MGVYAGIKGLIKIEPELTNIELIFFQNRMRNYIMSFDWIFDDIDEKMEMSSYIELEQKEIECAKRTTEEYIKMDRINIDPYHGINHHYLEFLAKMFQKRASGKVKIYSSTTYGDSKINGGWTNDENSFEVIVHEQISTNALQRLD